MLLTISCHKAAFLYEHKKASYSKYISSTISKQEWQWQEIYKANNYLFVVMNSMTRLPESIEV